MACGEGSVCVCVCSAHIHVCINMQEVMETVTERGGKVNTVFIIAVTWVKVMNRILSVCVCVYV